MTKKLPPLEYLHELFMYEPETGIVRWRNSRCGVSAGSEAGYLEQKPHTAYRCVLVDGELYRMHRIIFFLMTGRAPDIIDHINGNGADNRWANLREANPSQSRANTRGYNKSGLKGATLARNGKWVASIADAGKVRHLGSYETADEAHAAYCRAAVAAFGEFARFK